MRKSSKEDLETEKIKMRLDLPLQAFGIGLSLITLGYVFTDPTPNLIVSIVLISFGVSYILLTIWILFRDPERLRISLQNLAAIATIFSLWIAILTLWWGVDSFKTQVNIQNERNLNEHISNIKSLNLNSTSLSDWW